MAARDTSIAVAVVVAMLAVYGGAQLLGIPGVAGRFVGVDTRFVGYDAQIEGQAEFRGERGTRDQATGFCLDEPCRAAYSNVTLSVEDLPDAGDELHYLVYLVREEDDGTEHLKLGELEAGGDRRAMSVNRSGVDGRQWASIAVFLTAETDPSGEPGPTLYRHDYGPLEDDAPPPVNVSHEGLVTVQTPYGFRVDSGSVALRLSQPSRYPGLTRCVWTVDGPGVAGSTRTIDDTAYRVADPSGFEGSFTVEGCSRVQETWSWEGDDLEGADTILVTYEGGGGQGPRGWPLVHAQVTRTR